MRGFCGNISAEVDCSPLVAVNAPMEETMCSGEIEACKLVMSRASSQRSSSTDSGKIRMSKVAGVSSLLGRAGGAGIGKAVVVFDMLGSSMACLNPGRSFEKRVKRHGKKISILAFEVANTAAKGANIVHSLSMESMRHLNEVVLPSDGVQRLVSDDYSKLVRTAAADKREELKVFSDEVVRFGNQCEDPRWHNLDRYLAKFNPEIAQKMQLKEKVVGAMQYLTALVQCTAILYHEMYELGKFERDYQQRLKDTEHPAQRGDALLILKKELKRQRKHVKSLKKKSLWCRSLEEIIAKFVDIVLFLHAELHNIFGMADGDKDAEASNGHESLGSAGLALHYANVITQIFTLVTRPSSVPPSTRDALYQALPPRIRSALKSRLQSVQLNKELTVPRIKSELEKTLLWLFPIASNTISAHQGFGWVGEWAKIGTVMHRQPRLLKIETLHHAEKAKTEEYILELVVWLHHLVIHSRPGNILTRSPARSSVHSATIRLSISSLPVNKSVGSSVSNELQKDVNLQTLTPGICNSQDLDYCRPTTSEHKLSNKCSDSRSTKKER